MKKHIVRIIKVILVAAVAVTIVALSIDYYVEQNARKYIVNPDELTKADAILVLGAYVFPDGTVSSMLNDRLSVAQELYEKGKADKIIVSGDHGQNDYDEVNAMKSFLKNEKIPAENILMDHAGFSTYESVYLARDIFDAKKIIIVTQKYHLFRAVFIARQLGLDAYGVASDKHDYGEALMKVYRQREIAARNKDFFFAKFIKPKPTFLGEAIPVTSDGAVTDDDSK